MINYHQSKIYAITDTLANNILYIGGTVSNLSRRYYNHRYNSDDALNKYIKDNNIDWRNTKIELVKDYTYCCNRKDLRFASDLVTAFMMETNPAVLDYYLDNINYV
jgi:hypothetical protein